MTWLLANGGDVALRDADGDTPLHSCEEVDCAALLVAAGADLMAANDEGKIPYVVAAEDCRLDLAVYLKKVRWPRGGCCGCAETLPCTF